MRGIPPLIAGVPQMEKPAPSYSRSPSALRANAAKPNSRKNRAQLKGASAVPIMIRLKSYDAISSPVVL